MSSGFVTQQEIDEQKKARQEEWERVRKPDDPEIAPEIPYDPRSLFEQLEEHRIKKQDEWDESHKLKNQIRGLGNYHVHCKMAATIRVTPNIKALSYTLLKSLFQMMTNLIFLVQSIA